MNLIACSQSDFHNKHAFYCNTDNIGFLLTAFLCGLSYLEVALCRHRSATNTISIVLLIVFVY